jgi:hypothetical protein
VRTSTFSNFSSPPVYHYCIAMNDLPQELINRIVWFAERYPDEKWHVAIGQSKNKSPSQFPRLAILNHAWKEAVETITFYSVSIAGDELEEFSSIVTGHRRKYLFRLGFKALLPEYSYEACGRVESRTEQHLNSEAFAKGIYNLFAVLKAWEDDGLNTALVLEIRAPASPTDDRMSSPKYDDIRMDIALRKRTDILYHRWDDSVLQLLKPDLCPVLHNVRALHIDGNGSRRMASRVAPDLSISLPNLEIVDWTFPGYDLELSEEDSDSDLSVSDASSEAESMQAIVAPANRRREDRTAFADALRKTKLQPRSSIMISFYHSGPFDQRPTHPSVVPPELTYDPFSSALRNFSQNATTLDLDAQLDSTLFWPSPDEQNTSIPVWPHLKTLDIKLSMVSPSGEWYFTGPRPLDNIEDDPRRGIIGGDVAPGYSYCEFRAYPDPETFDPFLAALAKAVANMPVLDHFMLACKLKGPTGKLLISYDAPGIGSECGGEGPGDLEHRRVYYACEVGKVWMPDPKTAEGLRDAGRAKYGGEVIEQFVGSLYDQDWNET